MWVVLTKKYLIVCQLMIKLVDAARSGMCAAALERMRRQLFSSGLTTLFSNIHLDMAVKVIKLYEPVL